MSVSEKLFVCNEKNCTMTFSNEDHFTSHQKKHLMSFDLEFTGKDAIALLGDQTPTPTSFFRNCEEVGLFQDLQNVNPFEETFKKALESSNNDASKLSSLSLISNEDTLHTPHIFPSAEESIKNVVQNEKNDLSLVNFVGIPELNDKMEIIADINSNLKLKENQENFKTKLKEALLKKQKNKSVDHTNIVITDNILIFNSKNSVDDNTRCHISHKKELNSKSQQKQKMIREINRAAQIRCRNKKKILYHKLASDCEILKKENAVLKKENAKLKKHNLDLCKIVTELGGSARLNIEDKLTSLEDSNDPIEAQLKKLPVLAPATKISPLKNGLALPHSVFYNLVPLNVINTGRNSINEFSSSVPTLSPEVGKRKTVSTIFKTNIS